MAPEKTSERRHMALADDILSTGHLRTKSSKKSKLRRAEDEDEKFIDSRASRKILQIGQDLADEEAEETKASLDANSNLKKALEIDYSRFASKDGTDDDEDDGTQNAEDAWDDEDEEIADADVDPKDLDMFHKFVPREGAEDPIFGSANEENMNQGQNTNLADLILEKIAAFEAEQAGHDQSNEQPNIVGGGPAEDAVRIPTKALEVYSKVGYLLSRYKSGPLPKPFKILPAFPYWQALLDITRPDKWTPNAVYAGTRIFISAKPHVAQEYINTVLLERVRDDIRETKKLNVHVYNSLRKALYKPACFFKGLLFPLVGSGTCTLREAHIISSVIARVSIPVLHSAAALLRMCDMSAEETLRSLSSEGTGATNIFIRIFLEKKYALPYKVIDALVFHFLRFRALDDEKMKQSGSQGFKLPVLWHQSLLVFAQRYRNDITEDQREALLDLILVRGHKDIGPEIRRELLAGRGRGVVAPENTPKNDLGGDDTMDIEM